MVLQIREAYAATREQPAALPERILLLQSTHEVSKCSSKLQEATWIFFVNSLISFDEKQQIMAVFMKLDRGCKGYLDDNDLIHGFEELLGPDKSA